MAKKSTESGIPSDVASLDFSSIQVPKNATIMDITQHVEDDPRLFHDMLLSNPQQFEILQKNNPRLSSALVHGFETFQSILQEQLSERFARDQLQRMVNADPFDEETQRLIAEEIKQKNIEANMQAAIEHNPESYGTVVMLYINCFVNGYPVKAFVDSGAQMTIISTECAKRCNIMRLVDTNWNGIVRGVGEQKLIGRIHSVPLRIEQDFFVTSFCVLEDQTLDIILGLDILRRYQCIIDLTKNSLTIGTTGTQTGFLPESDLPDFARLSLCDIASSRMKDEDSQMN